MKNINNKIKRIKKLERKREKLTNKIIKLSHKCHNIELTLLNNKKIDNNVRRISTLLGDISLVILAGILIISLFDYKNIIMAYLPILGALGFIGVNAILSPIFLNKENYEQILWNKLVKKTKKIGKTDDKIDIINNKIEKIQDTLENKELVRNSSSQDAMISNSKENVNNNKTIALHKEYIALLKKDEDYKENEDYMDEMSPVVNSLKSEEIIYRGIVERPKVKKRIKK